MEAPTYPKLCGAVHAESLQRMDSHAASLLRYFWGTWLMFMAWQLRTNSPLSGIRHVGTAILILIPSEVLVGIVNALYRIPVPVSALHTAIAATLVGLIAYALSESVLLSNERESASTEQITARPARTGVAA